MGTIVSETIHWTPHDFFRSGDANHQLSIVLNPADILTAASSEQALEDRIAHQAGQIAATLSPFEPRSAVYAWFDTLRAIEELINLMTVEWDDDDSEASRSTGRPRRSAPRGHSWTDIPHSSRRGT